MTGPEVAAAMKAEEVDRAMVNEAANRLRLIHWDGMGCGTHGTSACTNCFGPSPMTAHEVAAEVLAAVLPEHNAHIAELAALIAGILNLAADATEIEYGAPFTWEEVAKKRGRALDEISDRIIAFEPPAARLTATTEEPK